MYMVTMANPEIANETRWGATYKIIQKYLLLSPDLIKCKFSTATKLLIPETEEIEQFAEKLHLCYEYQKSLQAVDGSVTMSILRVAFDNLIEAIPEMRDHLATDSNIVHSRDFENGVVKLQRNSESRLLPREKEALQCFLIDPNVAGEATVEQGAKEKPSLIEELQRKAAAVTAQSKTSATKYNSTNHVCGHTVIVESLFSTAGHIMTPSRKHMDPSTFEMLLLLKVNKDMYNALTLNEFIEELSKEEA